MSTTRKVELLGFPVTITGEPTTLAEAIASCGDGAIGEAKLLNKFVGYSNAHSTYGDGRSDVVAAVEQVTKVAQKEDEKDSVYVTRALAESGLAVSEILAKVEVKDESGAVIKTGIEAIEVEFDSGTSATRRSGVAKSASKTYIEKATNFLTNSPSETIENAVKGLMSLNPAFVLARGEDGKPTVDSFALLLKANSDRVAKEKADAEKALGL